MPSIFLLNLPSAKVDPIYFLDQSPFDSSKVAMLRREIALAARCRPEDVEIHVAGRQYDILKDTGYPAKAPILGFVIWYGSDLRDDKAKKIIADLLQEFLNSHHVGKGFNLTFLDLPSGAFFVESHKSMVMIPGGSRPKFGPDDGDSLG